MNRSEYNELAAAMERGHGVTDGQFAEMVAFAKARKIKRPVRPERVTAAAAAVRVRQRDLTCSADGCGNPAIAKGMCGRHHTAWWRAQDPARMERAREASRRYAARKRAERDAELTS